MKKAAALAAASCAAALVLAAAAGSAPDPDPSPGAKPRLQTEESGSRTRVVAGVLADIRSRDDYPVTQEAVRLVLLRFTETGESEWLALAESLVNRGPTAGEQLEIPAGPYLEVARAGGNTFATGEERLLRTRQLLAENPLQATTDSYAILVQDFFTRAAVWGTSDAYMEAATGAGALFSSRVRTVGTRVEVQPGGSQAAVASLSDHIACLETARLSYELSGTAVSRDFVVKLAHETLRRFWNEETNRLIATNIDLVGMPPSLGPLLNARAATVLWRCGEATENALFTGRARRILNGVFEEAMQYPESAPAVALGAALMDQPVLKLVLVGDAGDLTLTELRRTAFRVPDPRRILVHLNPIADAGRLGSYGVTADAAPALFVRAGSVGAPPVRDPSELENRVTEVWRAVASIPE